MPRLALLLALLPASALADAPVAVPVVPGVAHEWMPHAGPPAQDLGVAFAAPAYVPMRSAADRPSVTVYGYWPYWSDPLANLPWDQLTHVAIFDVGTDSNGNLTSVANWTNNAANAVALAHPQGVKVHLCLTSFVDATQASILNDPAKRLVLENNLAAQVSAYGADGVNVDFEGLDFALKSQFVSFITELSAKVGEVYVAMPAVDWNGSYDFDQIALNSDGLFVMGYDYYWSGGNPGPVAPLYGSTMWGTYAMDWSLTDYRTWGTPDDRIVMGLPLYGYQWPTTNTAVPGVKTASATSVTYSAGATQFALTGRNYNYESDSPYTFPSGTSQTFVDDGETIPLKADWAVSEAIQGFGFWALGYDDQDQNLWKQLDAISHQDGMQLALSPGTAGVKNTWTATAATANTTVIVYYSKTLGTAPLPGCVNYAQMGSATEVGRAVSNGTGTATISKKVPAGMAGTTVYFQAVESGTCRVSGVWTETL